MTWGESPTRIETLRTDRGEVSLVDRGQRALHEGDITAAGWLLANVAPPRPALRGRLALLVESAIEEELQRRGAPPPGVGASSDLDASLSDQLYRSRLVGSPGIALSMGSLEGIANLAGALEAEDSAVLRWWLAATEERPVRVLLAFEDRDLAVYDEPIPLARLLEPERESGIRRAPLAAPEVAQSSASMALSAAPETPPHLLPLEPDPSPVLPATMNDAEALMRAMAEIFSDDAKASDDFLAESPEAAAEESAEAVEAAEPYRGWAESAELVETRAEGEPPPVEAYAGDSLPPEACADENEPPPEAYADDAAESAPPPEAYADESPAPADVEDANAEDADAGDDEDDEDDDETIESEEPPTVQAADEVEPPTEIELPRARPTGPPLDPAAANDWQRWVRELETTRGPKPLAVIERTFVSAFVPLSDARSRGIAGESADAIIEAWSSSFAKSYSEAFDALKMRGKRPTMVLDVPEIALRIGRLHGARAVQLILVDGLRFDLGMRVNERLKVLLGRHAALTERLLLWSALPSRTANQLELIGRGAQGLREIGDGADSEVPVARGRAATTLRRVRAGHREVLKLDLVESALSVPGAPVAERFDCLADETAEALANHILKLAPRTLALVFGDHGFTLDPMNGGTSAGKSGGASPEEVLVPAFAWLVGAVH